MPKPPRRRPPAKPPSATRTGRMELLLEEIRDQNRATVEFVQAVDVRLRGEITQVRQALGADISMLQAAVRTNTEEMRAHGQAISRLDTSVARLDASVARLDASVHKNTEDIQANTEAITRVERKLDGKADTAVVASLEARVTTLEGNMR